MTASYDWTRRIGDMWAQEWRRTDRSFAGLAPHLDAAIRAAAPDRRFVALDIGSGAGATSIALADARADADVTGVDLSATLVAVARDRAGARANSRFVHADALEEATRRAPVDLLVSRHGVMFFADPQAAFATLHRTMAPAGKLVFSCFAGIADNPWATIVTAAPPPSSEYRPGPFAFADPDFVGAILAAAGWRDAAPVRIDFAYRVGAGEDPVADALAFLEHIGPAASALRDADPDARVALRRRLTDRLAAQPNHGVVDFPAAAWIWTASAGETHA